DQSRARCSMKASRTASTSASPSCSKNLPNIFKARTRTSSCRTSGRDSYHGRVRLEALTRFDCWCQDNHLRLEQLTPVHVAAYVETIGRELSRPSVKQHLAALRMLGDYLVVGQVIPSNPAASVRGPKYVVKKGKTPVLTRDEAGRLLASIPAD